MKDQNNPNDKVDYILDLLQYIELLYVVAKDNTIYNQKILS